MAAGHRERHLFGWGDAVPPSNAKGSCHESQSLYHRFAPDTVLSAAAVAQTASLDLNMSLPAGWQAQQTPQGAMLFPEGASRAESYLVVVSPAPAGANLNTPGVAQAALQMVVGQFPGLEAVDSPRVCTVAGEPGLQVVLAGQDAMTGQRVAVSVWLAMSNGRTIMVSAAGQSDLIARRLEALSQIAAGMRCSGVRLLSRSTSGRSRRTTFSRRQLRRSR